MPDQMITEIVQAHALRKGDTIEGVSGPITVAEDATPLGAGGEQVLLTLSRYGDAQVFPCPATAPMKRHVQS